jgi:DNA polymerase I-like protein with 3'-5' exonuclease and polymerase domains
VHLAAVWLEKEARHVSKEDRERTKHVVYALMYGAGKLRLAEILSVTVDQVYPSPPVPGS